MEKEIWKDIPEYEGYYQVNNLGKVKTLKRKNRLSEFVLKNSDSKEGYYYVYLRKNNIRKRKSIHQLVAMAFLNHTPSGYKLVVDHIDGNRKNNKLENIQIISQRENTSKKTIKVSSKYTGVCWHKFAKKWVAAIKINGKQKHLGYFNSELEAGKTYQAFLKNHILNK